MNDIMKLIETLESQINWAKENIPYAEPLDNVGTDDVERLIELSKEMVSEIKKLKEEVK